MTTAQLTDHPGHHHTGPMRRVRSGAGLAFVALTLAGNSLTESAVDPEAELTGEVALSQLAAKAGSTLAQVGLVLELVGFVALAVFVAQIVADGVRRSRPAVSAVLAAIAVTVMLAVKLGSGAPYVAGLAHHELISEDTALTLTVINGAGFVLCWLPFAVFVLAAAWSLRAAGDLGRLGLGTAVAIGGLGVLAGLVGALDTADANPVPFLLGCLWTAVVSVRLSVGRR
ncbi:MAG: hypothetical protein M3237_06240 [Actinomycetota bacterium]|nr:hypothetical protein [Actinomycetota bacterium]